MKNKDSPLSIFKIWLIGFIFPLILILLTYTIAYSQIISPQISITSSKDPAGVTININGTGFSAGSAATLYAKNPDGSQSGILSKGISPGGSFNISHLFPTGYPQGTYLLWVVDDSTGRHSNRINFNMPQTQSTEIRMPPPPYSPVYTPKHGDVVRAKGDTKIYLIHNFERRAIITEEVFRQMGFKKSDIKDIEPQDLVNIPEGPPIWSKVVIAPFPDGTLIKLKGTTRTYVIEGGRKCYIPDVETFHTRGYRWDQVKEVDQTTLDSIITGIPIASIKPPFQYAPPGQQPATQPPPLTGPPPIPPMIQTQPPSSTTPSQPFGSPTTQPGVGSTPYQTQPQSSSTFFTDGTLIKGSGPDIYLIQNGARRLIPDMDTFNAMGFNFANVVKTDDQTLGSVPIGIPFPQRNKKR